MFRHCYASTRDHERSRGRDIEGTVSVAAGSTGVHDWLPRDREFNLSGMTAHRLREAGNFFRRFSSGPKRDQQAGNLDLGHRTGHDVAHDLMRAGSIQNSACRYGPDE